MINCKYGHFAQDKREYVITDPYTPKPWINSISNGDYSMLISQMGGGFSYRINAEQNRLTRSFQDLVKDDWGKYYYIRDVDNGQFWTTSLLPIAEGNDSYIVRHGIGYTVIERQSYNIHTRVTVLVSADKPMEYASIELTNNRSEVAHLDITGYFEWAPGMAYDNHREFHRLFSDLTFDEHYNAIKVTKCLWGFPDSKGRHNNDDWPYTAFFACSDKVASYDCDKQSFLGMYRDEKDPQAMHTAMLGNSSGRYGDPVGCLRTNVITLQPGQSRTVVFCIGMAQHGKEDVHTLIDCCKVDNVPVELTAVGNMWDRLIMSNEWVSTPDEAFDTMTNIWAKYQTLSGRMWAKAGYYQISGGIGYRDQLQDSLVMLENDAQYTKKQLLLHAAHQFQKGDVQHWWLQLGGIGSRSNCSDDYLWLPFVLIRYIWETGDHDIMHTIVPYVDGGEPSTLYIHCVRAIELSLSRFSVRGIPLMGDHDWNDGLSAVGNGMKGESFWVAEFLYMIMRDFVPLAMHMADDSFAQKLISRGAQLKSDFDQHAWDGEWFLQATNDNGDEIGSSRCNEGKIFLNPQIWAVMSDITSQDKKEIAMQSVRRHLLGDYGALLLHPEYTAPDANIGYITRYAPGLRENGGVYTHAATWAVWASAMMGDNEMAYQYYSRICPPNRSADIDTYCAEPYVTCGNSDGPVSPNYGRGGWSWYTGSSQWLHGVGIWWILGVRPTIDGLCISPCIPSAWDGYTYKRTYRGTVYNIKVNNHTGEHQILVDGVAIEGDILPLKGGEVQVVVNLQ